ncbi:GDP-L-fucose synthase (plasmid) [Pseudoseohaeicola sp. NH-UV-7]|uniref:GDP-L-fucose synthase n=1 Tax=unclassified Sulfitobacter TaxID=196795 RepID=UPI000E0BE273|nr:GDP-L-fucose synthase [Sulfitobacter sp. JL08]AXI56680.1 GDP-fucose synthetase [Sulfitobacter sp. JL08]
MMFDLSGKRVWVAGHRGMVGGAVVRRLASEDCEIITAGRDVVDLTDQAGVDRWMEKTRPDAIVLAAAKVGGIHANNTMPAEFLRDNLVLETNVIHAAYQCGVEKLLFLGSSCIYPKLAPQPISEDALLTGPLEPTNEWYAIAKIAGIKMCQAYRKQYGCDFISAQPTNLYGPGDNYNLETSHVLPALLRKFHEAKESGAKSVTLWGSGTPLREFLHVDDLADALVFLLKSYSGDVPLNVGSGSEVTIRELAETIADVVGYKAELVFDPSKPDGTPRKLMDSSQLHALGWNNVRSLRDGIEQTYQALDGRFS